MLVNYNNLKKKNYNKYLFGKKKDHKEIGL